MIKISMFKTASPCLFFIPLPVSLKRADPWMGTAPAVFRPFSHYGFALLSLGILKFVWLLVYWSLVILCTVQQENIYFF